MTIPPGKTACLTLGLLLGVIGIGSARSQPPSTVELVPAIDVTNWPDAAFRWRDVDNNDYAQGYKDNYVYDDATVTLTYDQGPNTTFEGSLTATNLKPNFAYQIKIVGKPTSIWGMDGDDLANERIGFKGRWWRVQPNPGNTNDADYIANHDNPLYIFEGYLLFDFFVTDSDGSASASFSLDSSYHVLFWETQRAHQACDGPIRVSTVQGYASHPAYDVDVGPTDVGIYPEIERLCPGQTLLPSGIYNCRFLLTEESFHQSGDGGYWESALVYDDLYFELYTFTINYGAAATNSRNVTLNIDVEGANQMRFQNEDLGWSAWEDYAASWPWQLSAGDGTKTVHAEFNDGEATISQTSDTIELDETLPSVTTFLINNGDASTSSRTVTLTIDVSGASEMRFQNEALGWSAWENCATSRTWTLSAGDGTKTVHAEFRDEVQNMSPASDDIVLAGGADPPPGPVTNITAEPGCEKISISWVAPGDLDLARYHVYRGMWRGGPGTGPEQSDYVDIGDGGDDPVLPPYTVPPTEGLPMGGAPRNMIGWSPTQPFETGGGYGGIHHCRTVWSPTEYDLPHESWADIDLDFGPAGGTKTLWIRYLDGASTDDQQYYIDGLEIGPKVETGDPGENWYWWDSATSGTVDLSSYVGYHTLRIESTEPPGPYWLSSGGIPYGQVAIDKIYIEIDTSASAYPEFDAGVYPPPPRPGSKAEADASSDWALVHSTADASELFYLDDPGPGNWPRGVYYYEVFAEDLTGQYSPPADANDRATNYWLGDVSDGTYGQYNGYVDIQDINALAVSYGTGLRDECDVGPTDDYTGTGIPEPDDFVDFSDLMIFALNYGTTAPAKMRPGGLETVHMAWIQLDPGTWSLQLSQPARFLKGLNLRAELPQGVVPSLVSGPLLQEQTAPCFLENIDGHGLDVGLALLGNGRAIQGQGELFRVIIPGQTELGPLQLQVRNLANEPLDFEFSAPGPDALPREFRLAQNVPNPFNPQTKIRFDLPRSEFVVLAVYDLAGHRVVTLVDKVYQAGSHSVIWNGRNEAGSQVSSGVYFYRLEAGSFRQIRKMILLK